MLGVFDLDEDEAITLDEFRNSFIVESLLPPDVDVFDANGDYCQLCDGVEESMSVGIGFTEVPALRLP